MELIASLLVCSIPATILCALIVGCSFLLAVFYKIVFGIPIRETMEELGW